jgi:hypothetical protein
MRAWPATLLCAATGCAQIFGLDTTTSAPDANVDRASLQIQRVSVGATVIKAPQDLTGQTASFYQDDGAGALIKVAGELGPMDTFTAPINTGTPAVMFTLPDMTSHYFATPARAQKGSYTVFEHPNPEPAAATAKIMLSATLPSPYTGTEQFYLYSVGAWTQHQLTAAELPDPLASSTTIAPTAPIDYSSFSSIFDPTMKTRIIASDYLLLLRYQNATLTGVMQSQFEQSDMTDPVSGSMTAVNATDSVSVMIDPAGYSTRFSAVRPAPSGLGMAWYLTAAPGASVGATSGVQLKSGGAAMTDTMVTTMFANPFESLSWKSLFIYITSTNRMTAYTYMGMPVALGAGMTQVFEKGSMTAVTMPAGLPITVRANLTTLTTDGMSVMLDLTKPVEISADIDRTSGISAYAVTLSEIQPNGSLEAVTTAAFTGMPKINLPQELFSVGKTYVIRFTTYAGAFTAAATGDFQTFTLPYSSAYLDSGAFTVVDQ